MDKPGGSSEVFSFPTKNRFTILKTDNLANDLAPFYVRSDNIRQWNIGGHAHQKSGGPLEYDVLGYHRIASPCATYYLFTKNVGWDQF